VVWALSFVLQFAVVTVVIVWTSNWLGDNLKILARPYDFLDVPVRLARILLPTFVGFLAGCMAKDFPGIFREPGRWLWVVALPLSIILLTAPFFISLDHLWVSLFGVRGYDYSGIGVVGLLFPLGGVGLYSIGVHLGDTYTDPLKDAEKDRGLRMMR
jgi:hypothetical protein